MNEELAYVYYFYNCKLTQMIANKYGLNPMDALRRFLNSKTFNMLSDPRLEMREFSPFGIFDMWESEQVTGDPRNSLYIRRD